MFAHPNRMTWIRFISVLLLTLAAGHAYAELYKCTDSKNRVIYTDDKEGNKNCTPLDKNLPVSTIPSGSSDDKNTAPASTGKQATKDQPQTFRHRLVKRMLDIGNGL